jgi:hypothetical protein
VLRLFSLESARWIKAKLPGKPRPIPPSSQPLIMLYQTFLRMLRCRIQFALSFPNRSPANNTNKAKSSSTSNNNNSKEASEAEFDELEFAEKNLKTAKEIIIKLLTECETSSSLKSLEASLLEVALFYYVYIDSLGKVELPPEARKPEVPTIRERQLKEVESLREILKKIDPQKNSKFIEAAKMLCVKVSQTTFYQKVSKDEMRQIFEVMGRDVGTGVGSFGGHWYTCSKGHIYAIGECGGAMQQSKCPECGEIIGGSNHRLVNNNSVATDFLAQVNGAAPSEDWQDQARQNGF